MCVPIDSRSLCVGSSTTPKIEALFVETAVILTNLDTYVVLNSFVAKWLRGSDWRHSGIRAKSHVNI